MSAGLRSFWFYTPETCPSGPHRGPQGPNEDVAQCHGCGGVSHALRPEGDTFCEHTEDCALPERHEGCCSPVGGDRDE